MGTLVLWGTGWRGGVVQAAFFVSSNLVSRLADPPPWSDAKGERRDQLQVLANGGPAALVALLGLEQQTLALWAVTGSLAAAAADTWATSVGSLSPTPPRLLMGAHRVPPGTSGGVTPLGCGGALLGALLVAAAGSLVGGGWALLPAATLIGFVGMLADAALGSAMQGRFLCPRCGEPSERRVHRCGAHTVRQGGITWLDNDGVNLAATALAASLAVAAWKLWPR